jgi:hypothetical protein
MFASLSKPNYWNVDIDNFLNPIFPPNILPSLPKPISRFLGHRSHAFIEPGNVLIALWALITTYVGLLLVAIAFRYSGWIQSLDPPVLIGSLVRYPRSSD